MHVSYMDMYTVVVNLPLARVTLFQPFTMHCITQISVDTVECLLKARTVKLAETAAARDWLCKHSHC
jgi:hypothetical protein